MLIGLLSVIVIIAFVNNSYIYLVFFYLNLNLSDKIFTG